MCPGNLVDFIHLVLGHHIDPDRELARPVIDVFGIEVHAVCCLPAGKVTASLVGLLAGNGTALQRLPAAVTPVNDDVVETVALVFDIITTGIGGVGGHGPWRIGNGDSGAVEAHCLARIMVEVLVHVPCFRFLKINRQLQVIVALVTAHSGGPLPGQAQGPLFGQLHLDFLTRLAFLPDRRVFPGHKDDACFFPYRQRSALFLLGRG